MYVGQDIIDIDGIEHKPLKLTGEPDKIEVGEMKKERESIHYPAFSSVRNNTFSKISWNRVHESQAIASTRINLVDHLTMITVPE